MDVANEQILIVIYVLPERKRFSQREANVALGIKLWNSYTAF